MPVTQSVDPVTGRAVLTIPQFGHRDRNDESRMGAPIAQVGGITVEELAAEQDRSQAVRELTDLGIQLPKSVDDATAVLDALRAVQVSVPVPNLGDAGPDDAVALLHEYTERRAFESVAGDAKARMLVQASARLENSLDEALNVALKELAEMYALDAVVVVKGAELVTRYSSLAEVAEVDPTGKLVAQYHNVVAAAKRMNGFADIVLRLTRVAGRPFRSSDNAARHACLVADFSTSDSVLTFAHADNVTLRGAITGANPLGPYPALLAAGATLSMPANRDQWSSRIDTYRELVDAAAIEIFRPEFSNAA